MKSSLRVRAKRLRQNVSAPAVTSMLGLGEGPKINCPFHPDDTPSMHIYPHNLKCYGLCSKGYSVIDVVMQNQNLTLPEAIDWLEERFGYDSTFVHPEEESPLAVTNYLWEEADKQITAIVRPYFLEDPKMMSAVDKAYAFWDRISEEAKNRGESVSKVLSRAADKIRAFLEAQ